MEKKGSIGSGITWVSATVLLVFILGFYLVGAFVLSGFSLNHERVGIEKEIKVLDYSINKNVISFLESNSEAVSQWVEGDDGNSFVICEAFKSVNDFNFEDGSLFLENEKGKNVLIDERNGKVFCTTTGGFFYNSQIISKVYFVANDGQVVEVNYVKK